MWRHATCPHFPTMPDHFLRWVSTRPEFEAVPEIDLRERFIPRQTYGDYVSFVAQKYLAASGNGTPVSSRFVIGEAVDIEPQEFGCLVRLADGSTLEADRVVLATGNETPASLPGAEGLAEHPAWIGRSVAGLGRTVAAEGLNRRRSRYRPDGGRRDHHPAHHRVAGHHPRGVAARMVPACTLQRNRVPRIPAPGVDLTSLGLDELVALVKHHCAVLHERNAHPAIIVDKLRPHTQRIWAGFSPEERLAFAKSHAAKWNVFRHRISPDIHAQLTHLQLTGQLQLRAAGIEKLGESSDRISVHLDDGDTLVGDVVLNATGPSTRLTATNSVLLQNLLRRGLITPDATDMGISVAEDHTVLTGDGDRSAWLLAMGPLIRGTYWETVAVPELRGQAKRVAETALDRVHSDEEEGPELLEYML